MIPYTTNPQHFDWPSIREGLIDLGKHALLLAAIILCMLFLTSCGTTRQVAIVDRIHQDTIYINQTQYDSIFVSQQHSSDYHLNPLNPLKQSETDTLYVKDIKVEYRYKLLRDTVRIHQVDSIPVIKEVEVTKEVRYIPWYSKFLSWVGAVAFGVLLVFILRFVLKYFSLIPKL